MVNLLAAHGPKSPFTEFFINRTEFAKLLGEILIP